MLKVLLIDDDDTVRDAVRFGLLKLKHTVVATNDGREALRLFRDSPTDLVITDLVMPEHDGFETIRDFRKEFPKIPIIAMSGGGKIGAGEYLAIAKKLGASETLTKPFSVDELDAAIQTIFRSAQ